METKKCKTCGIEKELTEYYKNISCKDGLRKACKACEVKRQVERDKLVRAEKRVQREADKKKRKERLEKHLKEQEEKKRGRPRTGMFVHLPDKNENMTDEEYKAIAKFNIEKRAKLLNKYNESIKTEKLPKQYSYNELLEKQVEENRLDKSDMDDSLYRQRNYSGVREYNC